MNNRYALLLILTSFGASAFSMQEQVMTREKITAVLTTSGRQVTLTLNGAQKAQTYNFVTKPIVTIDESDGDFYRYAHTVAHVRAQVIIDLWPLNGSCNSRQNRFISHLFKDEELQELRQQISLVRNNVLPQVRLFVLDLKDSQGRYENLEKIEQAELLVRDIIQKGEHTVSALLLDNHICYFLREGLLKAVVLRTLLKEPANFFQDKQGDGPQLLCILCELIMNEFKRGNHVEIQQDGRILADLHPCGFFVSLVNTKTSVSTVPALLLDDHLKKTYLQTYYSAYYQRLYSKENIYFKLAEQCYKAEHQVDASSSTIITLKDT